MDNYSISLKLGSFERYYCPNLSERWFSIFWNYLFTTLNPILTNSFYSIKNNIFCSIFCASHKSFYETIPRSQRCTFIFKKLLLVCMHLFMRKNTQSIYCDFKNNKVRYHLSMRIFLFQYFHFTIYSR